ncbi:MAG: outer membrane protein [Verrucomicrobiota bacterium]|jgi:outer membrane protein
MKNLRLLIVAALMAAALTASAQSKIASVDMKKIFNGYLKTKTAQSIMDKKKSELIKELKDMAEGLDQARKDYKQLLDQSNDQAISADERDKRKASATEKSRDVSSRQVAFEQYQRQAETRLADESQRMVSGLVGEIQKAVADKARLGSYTLVVDTASASSTGTPAVLYADPATDITPSVLAQLNAGLTVDAIKPAGGLLNISTNAP